MIILQPALFREASHIDFADFLENSPGNVKNYLLIFLAKTPLSHVFQYLSCAIPLSLAAIKIESKSVHKYYLNNTDFVKNRRN